MIRIRSLLRDSSGSTIVEFALVLPVLMVLLLGCFDLGHGIYTKAMLMGSIQKVARNSTIQSAVTGTLDAKVTAAVRQIAPGSTVTFQRTHYASFSDVSQPEAWTDVNGNKACDSGEPFEDANGNGAWDADRGRTGQGGARDAVLYKVTVSYPRLFPIARLLRQSNTMQVVSSTVLRNQPYTLQQLPSKTGNCA